MIPSFFKSLGTRVWLKSHLRLYRWEDLVKCPVCGHQEAFKAHSQHRFGRLLSLSLQQCSQCQLVFQSPRLNGTSLGRFYDTDYRSHSQISKAQQEVHYENMFQRGERQGEKIQQFLKPFGRLSSEGLVLEVGCAYGGILSTWQKAGYQVKGSDLDTQAVAYGRQQGLELYDGGVEALSAEQGKADLVILRHVLEHLTQPQEVLQQIHQLLKPEGLLYIEVPGIGEDEVNWERIVQIGHLLYFQQSSLTPLVESCGFEYLSGNESLQAGFVKTGNG